MLILAMFSWRKGRCVSLRSNAHRQSKQTSISLQLWLRRGLQSRVNGRHMLHRHMALSSVALCSWTRQTGRQSVFFWCVPWRKKVLWLCRNLFFAPFTVKTGSCQIQKWWVSDLTQDLFRQTRLLSWFLICWLSPIHETNTHTFFILHSFLS